MRRILLKWLRSKWIQPLWERLNHLSLIGMNYFGGASLNSSGEIGAIEYMKQRLEGKDQILIFDIGANSGEYAMILHSIFGAKAVVHSFEPSAFTFELLVKNVSRIDGILTYKLGLGSENETLKLYSSGRGNTTSSVYNLSHKSNPFVDEFTEEVDLVSLDWFCDQNNIMYIDIAKIDIEGHELKAIEGATKLIRSGSIRFIQFEFGKCNIDSKVYFRDFYDVLSPRYRLYRIVSDGLIEIDKYTPSLEVFHTANFLAEYRYS